MLKETIEETTKEDILEEIFNIAKTTSDDNAKIHALLSIIQHAKDKEFYEKMIETFALSSEIKGENKCTI